MRRLMIRTEGKRPLGDTDIDGMITLRWSFMKWDVEVRTGTSWLRIGTGGRNLGMK
jgi:hypothetical protein